MDRQSAMQGSGGATKDCWPYAGGRQPEQAVDGAFLMELLEDAPAADQQPPEDVDDRLRRVIRSLEAEIDGGPPPSAPADGERTAEYVPSELVDGGLDDMLSDLDSSPGTCEVGAPPPFEYWGEVPPALGHVDMHDLGSWYVDGDGVVVGGGYEFREQCYYGYGESPAVEHVYSPLWE